MSLSSGTDLLLARTTIGECTEFHIREDVRYWRRTIRHLSNYIGGKIKRVLTFNLCDSTSSLQAMRVLTDIRIARMMIRITWLTNTDLETLNRKELLMRSHLYERRVGAVEETWVGHICVASWTTLLITAYENESRTVHEPLEHCTG